MLAVLTLVVGAVLAIVQTDVKRMLAYSSISHAGFILVGVEAGAAASAGHRRRARSSTCWPTPFMVLGTFAVVALVGPAGDGDHDIARRSGASSQPRPLLAFTFTVFLLAQAGVPLTSGFIAKFDVIMAAVDAGATSLAVIAMVSRRDRRVPLPADHRGHVHLRAEGEALRPVLRRRARSAALGLAVALAFTVVVGILPSVRGRLRPRRRRTSRRDLGTFAEVTR